MLGELTRYYEKHHIHPLNFACPHHRECSAGAPGFTPALMSYVGPAYEKGTVPRLLFLSLDSGSGRSEPDYRTAIAVRQREVNRDVEALHKNKHWYVTHEMTFVLLKQFVPGLTIATTSPYFAHVNSAKCCQNNPQRREASGVLFDNCRKFIPGELEILMPDIIVSQGGQARRVIRKGFEVVEVVGSGECSASVIRCAATRTLWIHTHHPSGYGSFHDQKRTCWQRYVQIVGAFIARRQLGPPRPAGSSATTPRLLKKRATS